MTAPEPLFAERPLVRRLGVALLWTGGMAVFLLISQLVVGDWKNLAVWSRYGRLPIFPHWFYVAGGALLGAALVALLAPLGTSVARRRAIGALGGLPLAVHTYVLAFVQHSLLERFQLATIAIGVLIIASVIAQDTVFGSPWTSAERDAAPHYELDGVP